MATKILSNQDGTPSSTAQNLSHVLVGTAIAAVIGTASKSSTVFVVMLLLVAFLHAQFDSPVASKLAATGL